MEFGLAIIGNLNQEKSDIIDELSKKMEIFFSKKNYGQDIKSYTIGIICVTPEFDSFFKGTKPKYTKGIKTINPDGIPFTLENSFEYSIKISFKDFTTSNEAQAKKILSNEILKSTILLNDFTSKIKNFKIEEFKSDLKNFFKER